MLETKSCTDNLAGGSTLIDDSAAGRENSQTFACMTWDLGESGQNFVTTIINGSDLVPTFSLVSADNLRFEVDAAGTSRRNTLGSNIEAEPTQEKKTTENCGGRKCRKRSPLTKVSMRRQTGTAKVIRRLERHTVYGMVQCTRDLEGGNCWDCLDLVTGWIPTVGGCWNSSGCNLLYCNCVIRYEMYNFLSPVDASPSSCRSTDLPETISVSQHK
ncbi:Cysteine-rich repeat secretory protein 55 [Apostasia shenzhenica]|uniref:Cysteine-rich repeat secretory protein 55 n=1 Tax=Apostasia shenzhenica TaxID=1088818 RepID=A0A2I0AS68_9ASPA|nr:Cysteine-rich repeat secretory protein 55 [Apostasia shenzhenica]PKA58399.1 Cysteine-rich repeat secretory protein 55 [Apostasia shenzhenica]